MNVDLFNRTIAYHWLEMDKDLPVKIINNSDPDEILIEVDGKRIWVPKRRHVRTEPKKAPERRQHAEGSQSTLDPRLVKLTPQAFKAYFWLLNLKVNLFTLRKAAPDLEMTPVTLRRCLKEIQAAGLMKIVDSKEHVGYTVEVIQ